MKWILFLLTGAILSGLASCDKVTGSGPIVSETVQTGSFTGISLEIPAKLYYTASPSTAQKVEIKAPRNILDVLRTETQQGDIRFRLKNNISISGRESIEVHIHAPDVLRLKIAGSGEIHVLNDFKPGSLLIRTNGSGFVSVNNLETLLMNTEINGSGKLGIMNGKISTGGVDISGSGTVEMPDVITDSVSCKIQGSGNVKLHASDFLHVTISGSGTVMYKGNPVVESNISGSGKLIRF